MTAHTSSTTAASVCRPLSPLERWYWIADRISPLNVIARAQVRGPLPVPLLRQALNALQDRHPLLRVAIAADAAGRDPWFMPCPGSPIPLRRRSLTAGTDTNPAAWWEREVDEQELPDPIDGAAGPLARAVVLTQGAPDGTGEHVHDLLLTLSHSIADGTTALALLEEWIRLAARLGGAAEEVAAAPGPAGWRALPAPEAMFPRRHRGLPGAIGALTRQLRDQLDRQRTRARRVAPSQAVPVEQRRTRLLHRSLAPEELDALSRACRREGATVHGALAAAMVTAVADDAGAAAEPGHYVIGSPVDFRGQLLPPVSLHEAGAYVATLPSYVAYRPGLPLWPMARDVSRDLARRRRAGDHFAMINLLGLAGPATPATSGPFVRRVASSGPGNLCLSNIGRYDFPESVGQWQVTGAQFIAGISVSGCFVATVNTSHGHLHWNFTHVEDIVPRPRAERLATACVDGLLSAVRPASRRPPSTQHTKHR
ncbi:phthiocerol/phthiodiolone dimycocerosyl transferase family protein [Streptomyces halobius]|uniref:Phthiocerol/phthiodiolone dimycocerosyl transferase n=1 Tax=Streptomyces halobius TaxID=2879846 RepID=A0ABY4ML98_9ACTN|nr:short-chain dehydrogenase [Streptomyces halobius]UQA97196.1 short-chain dehydrogenase [Streptomyces halobius]